MVVCRIAPCFSSSSPAALTRQLRRHGRCQQGHPLSHTSPERPAPNAPCRHHPHHTMTPQDTLRSSEPLVAPRAARMLFHGPPGHRFVQGTRAFRFLLAEVTVRSKVHTFGGCPSQPPSSPRKIPEVLQCPEPRSGSRNERYAPQLDPILARPHFWLGPNRSSQVMKSGSANNDTRQLGEFRGLQQTGASEGCCPSAAAGCPPP